jgi:hypothetical protein
LAAAVTPGGRTDLGAALWCTSMGLCLPMWCHEFGRDDACSGSDSMLPRCPLRQRHHTAENSHAAYKAFTTARCNPDVVAGRGFGIASWHIARIGRKGACRARADQWRPDHQEPISGLPSGSEAALASAYFIGRKAPIERSMGATRQSPWSRVLGTVPADDNERQTTIGWPAQGFNTPTGRA